MVFDPFGWAAFGPLKWAVVSTLSLAAAATMWLLPFRHHPPTTIAWGAFLAWGAICAGFGLDPLYAWIGTPDRHLGWATWAIFGLVFLVGQNLAQDQRVLARAATMAIAGVSLYGLLELAGRPPVDLVVESARIGGPLGSPAYLGAACVLLLPMTASLAAEGAERKPWRWVAGASFVGGLVTVVASQTRAAWLGLVAAAAVSLPVWWPRMRSRWWLWGAAVVVVALVTPVVSRTADAFQGDLRARADEWRMGVGVMSNHPLLGVGPEGYRLAFPSVVDADYERRYTRRTTPDRAHNGALDTAATFGLPGLLAYVTGTFVLVGRSWRAVRTEKPLVMGAGAAVIGYLVQQQLLFPIAEIDVLFWLLAGIVVATTGPSSQVTKPPKVVAIVLGSLSVLALMGGVADVAADHRVIDSQRNPLTAPAKTDRAVSLRPDSIRYWLIAADARARNGDWPAAIRRIDRALSISPLDPILLATKGRILLAIAGSTGSDEDSSRVAGFYERLLASDPNNAQNQLRAGAAFSLAGSSSAAEEAFLRASDLAPTSSVPLANLARLYLDIGRLENALEAYESAVAIDPTSPGLDEIAELLRAEGAIIDG